MYFLAFGNSRGVCSLVFGCYSIACFCKLLHAVICVIVRHGLYEAYVTGQGHSKASLLANRTFRFIFLLQILFAFAFCFLPFLIFSSFCLLKSFAQRALDIFLIAFFLFIKSRLIFPHISLQCAVLIYYIKCVIDLL